MKAKEGMWSWSLDGESYEGVFDTMEGAIENARLLGFGAAYVAPVKEVLDAEHVFVDAIDAQWVFDTVEQFIDDNYGPGDDRLDVSEAAAKDLEDKLKKLLSQWLEEHGVTVNWFVCGEATLVKLGEESKTT